jgi:hypothetical protein
MSKSNTVTFLAVVTLKYLNKTILNRLLQLVIPNIKKKRTNVLNRGFSKEEVQMAKTHNEMLNIHGHEEMLNQIT